MANDPRTDALLANYRNEVEKTARTIYLQAIALKRELDAKKINPEDKLTILMHTINILTGSQRPENNPNQNG
jgi:hypothetical protein